MRLQITIRFRTDRLCNRDAFITEYVPLGAITEFNHKHPFTKKMYDGSSHAHTNRLDAITNLKTMAEASCDTSVLFWSGAEVRDGPNS